MENACTDKKGKDVWVVFMIPGIGCESRLLQDSWIGLIGDDI